MRRLSSPRRGRVPSEPVVVPVVSGLGAEALDDLGPGRSPAPRAGDGAQPRHGVDARPAPAHHAALEPDLHHQLPGVLDGTDPDGYHWASKQPIALSRVVAAVAGSDAAATGRARSVARIAAAPRA